MNEVQAGIVFTAIMDGTTVNGYPKVFNTPLIQRYSKGGNKYIPDFETLTEAKKPVVVALLRDAMTGEVLIPKTLEFKYNGTLLTFGADGLCNTSGFVGIFKKLTNYAVTVGADTSKTYQMTALQVVKNLVPISGYDNDTITLSGTVEIEGQTLQFAEISTSVVIQESTGNQYDVIVEDDNGGCLDKTKDSITLKMTLLKDSVEVSDLSGYTIKWFKVSAPADTPMSSTGKTQVVNKDDVNNKQVFKCEVAYNGDKMYGYREICDYTDNYYIRWNVADASGAAKATALRKGDAVKTNPVAVSRESGNEIALKECTFRTKDNAGKDFTLTGKSGASFTLTAPQINVDITYGDVQRAGYGLHVLANGKL